MEWGIAESLYEKMVNGWIIKTVKTDTAGWQLECWKLAQARKQFELDGFAEQHDSFCKELCEGYGYKTRKVEKKMIFIPPDANSPDTRSRPSVP